MFKGCQRFVCQHHAHVSAGNVVTCNDCNGRLRSAPRRKAIFVFLLLLFLVGVLAFIGLFCAGIYTWPQREMPNTACNPVVAGMTVNLLGECVKSCQTEKPGFHDIGGKCLADVPAPVEPVSNNQCTPAVPKFSVNVVT